MARRRSEEYQAFKERQVESRATSAPKRATAARAEHGSDGAYERYQGGAATTARAGNGFQQALNKYAPAKDNTASDGALNRFETGVVKQEQRAGHLANYEKYAPEQAARYADLDMLYDEQLKTGVTPSKEQIAGYSSDELATWWVERQQRDQKKTYAELDALYDEQLKTGATPSKEQIAPYSKKALDGWRADRQQRDYIKSLALDDTVLEAVRADWHAGLYPDQADPEDIANVEAGGIPKNLHKNYDLNDPFERYLFENNLPPASTFNKSYNKAVDALNAKGAEDAAYQDQFDAFTTEFYNALFTAQQTETQTAAREGRNPQQIDPETLISTILNSGKYDDVAANFRPPDEDEDAKDTATYASIAAKQKEAAAKDKNPRAFTPQDLMDEFLSLSAGVEAANDAEANSTAPEAAGNTEAERLTPEELTALDAQIDALDAQIAELEEGGETTTNAALASAQPTDEELAAAYRESAQTGESADMILLRQQQSRATDFATPLNELRAQRATLETQRNMIKGGRDIYAARNTFATQYAPLAQKKDFAENARMTGRKDGWSDEQSDAYFDIQTSGGGFTTNPHFASRYMTDEEHAIFNYITNTDGIDAALSYYDDLAPMLNQRNYADKDVQAARMAADYPILNSIGSSVFGQFLSAVEGANAEISGGLYELTGGKAGRELVYQDPRLSQTYRREQMRANVRANIEATTGDALYGMVYDMAMSVGDNAVRAVTFGGAGALGAALSSATMGGQVMGSTISEYMQKGASNKQALLMGALAGGCEALGEAVDMAALLKITDPAAMAKAGLKSGKALTPARMVGSYMATNAVTETGSEMVTELATYAADLIVMQDRAEVNEIYNAAKAEGKTNGDAFFAVVGKVAADVGVAGLGGLISGAILGGGNLALNLSSTGKAVGAPIGQRMGAGARATAGNINENVALQESLTQTYETLLADGTAKDATARMEIMDDIHALGLDSEMTETLNALADQFASSPASLISPEAQQTLDRFQAAVHKAAGDAAIVDADAKAKQAKAQQRLTGLYDAVTRYQQEARTALEAGNLPGHTKAMGKLRSAISAYSSATETAQAEAAAQTLKTEAAKSTATRAATEAGKTLSDLVEPETAYQLGRLNVFRESAAVGDMVDADTATQMGALYDALVSQESDADAERALTSPSAKDEFADLEYTAADALAEMARAQENKDPAAYARAQDIYDELVANGSTPSGGDAMMDEMAKGAQQDGTDDAKRGAQRTDGIRDGQRGRNDDGAPQRADTGGLRESAAGHQPRTPKDTRARQLRSLEAWDAASARSTLESLAAWYNAARRKGSPQLAAADIAPAKRPSDQALDAIESAQNFLGGQKTLLFTARDGIRAPFGATFAGREYVRDTGDDLVAFHKGHERAHNVKAYREAGAAAFKAFGGEDGSLYARYLECVDEHPQTREERKRMQTEFLCDVFGAYVYSKATGKDVAGRLGLTEDNKTVFYRAFDEVMRARAFEDSDAVADKTTGTVELSEHDVGTKPTTREESLALDLLDERNVSRYQNEITAALDRSMPSWQNILVGKPPAILVEYMKSDKPLYMVQSAATKAAFPTTEKGGKHGLGRGVLDELLPQLSDPMAITGNTGKHKSVGDNSVIVWTDWATEAGNSVIVPIRIDVDGGVEIYNNINTMFDVYNKNYEAELLADDNVLYKRDGKSIEELLSQRRQVPKSRSIDAVSTHTMPETAENVKADTKNSQSELSTHDLGASDTATPSRQTAALDLYDRGMTAEDYYRESSANGTYNPDVAAELAGIRLRNGEAEGGRMSNDYMLKFGKDAENFKAAVRPVNTVKSPLRVIEDMGRWRDEKTNKGLLLNSEASEEYSDKLYLYPRTQLMKRNLFVAEQNAAVAAIGANDIESALAQCVGRGDITEEIARNAVTDGRHIITYDDDGAMVIDKNGNRRMLTDGKTLYTFDDNYHKRRSELRKAKKVEYDKAGGGDPDRIKALEQEYSSMKPTEEPGSFTVTANGGHVAILGADGNPVFEMFDAQPAYTERAATLKDTLRGIYDKIADLYQAALVSSGYPTAGRRSNYFPNIGREINGLNAVIQYLRDQDLPVDIAGRTDTFKPGKPWDANLLARTSDETEYDAVRGFNNYIDKISDVIFLTPVVQRFRQFEHALRYGVEGADGERTKTSPQNAAMAEWLNEQANIWAGKQAKFDRGPESWFGRGVFKVQSKLAGVVGTSKVAVNVSVALSQLLAFAQSAGQLDLRDTLHGVTATLAGKINGGTEYDLESRLPFLVNRLSEVDQIETNLWDKTKQKGSKLLYAFNSAFDRFTANSVANAKYHELMRKGYSDETALKRTDAYCMKLMADRSKGAKPNLFNSKVLSPFTQFQLEPVNQLWHFRDMHRENVLAEYDRILKENGGTLDGIDFAAMENQINRMGVGWKDAAKIIGYLISMSLFNQLMRKIKGSDSAFNPYGTAKDLISDYSDGGMEAVAKGLLDTAKDNLPFASMGDRGVPLVQGIKDVKTAFADMKEARDAAKNGGEYDVWGGLVNPALNIAATALPGGGQLKKTVTGLHANAEGGAFSATGKLRYPIETGGQKWRSAVFGPSAAAPSGYAWGKDVLSDKQTEAYRALTDEGLDAQNVYELMLNYNAKNTETKALSLAMGAEDFSPGELDGIADELGVDYDHKKDGDVMEWAVNMARDDLEGLRKKVKKGKATQDTLDEYMTIYDEYFRMLGVG